MCHAIRSRPLHVPDSAVVARWCNTEKEGELNYMTPDLDDYDGILAGVQAYIDGWNERDPNKFRRGVLEGAWMLYIDEAGSLTQGAALTTSNSEEWAKNTRLPQCRIAGAVRSADGRRRFCRPCLGD